MRVHCPHCRKSLRVGVDFAGKRAKCPACGQTMTIPLTREEQIIATTPEPNAASRGTDPPGLGTSTKVAIAACGMVCFAAICFLVWFVAIRDTWEIDNSARIAQMIDEANRIRESEPLRAYKLYEELIRESSDRIIRDEDFAERIQAAALARDELRDQHHAEIEREAAQAARMKVLAEQEAERQRAAQLAREAEETRRLAAEEAQRIAAEKRRKEAAEIIEEIDRRYRRAPPSARNALNALKRVEARVEVGVTYNDYLKIVGESWGDVKIFIESPEGKSLPELNAILGKAVADYKLAMDIWQSRVRYSTLYGDRTDVELLQQRCWLRASEWITLSESLLDPDQTERALEAIEKALKDENDLQIEWTKINDRILGKGG